MKKIILGVLLFTSTLSFAAGDSCGDQFQQAQTARNDLQEIANDEGWMTGRTVENYMEMFPAANRLMTTRSGGLFNRPPRVFEAGPGRAYFLQSLLRRHPEAQVYAASLERETPEGLINPPRTSHVEYFSGFLASLSLSHLYKTMDYVFDMVAALTYSENISADLEVSLNLLRVGGTYSASLPTTGIAKALGQIDWDAGETLETYRMQFLTFEGEADNNVALVRWLNSIRGIRVISPRSADDMTAMSYKEQGFKIIIQRTSGRPIRVPPVELVSWDWYPTPATRVFRFVR